VELFPSVRHEGVSIQCDRTTRAVPRRRSRAAFLSCALVIASLGGLPAPRVHAATDAAQAAYDKGDYERALSLWQQRAAKNDPVAQFSIGVMYERGLGVAVDTAEAVRYYRTAAKAGFAAAQFNLGAAYESGRGLEKSLPQAAHWWRQAADQGFTRAQYNLGVLYYYGWGVDKDLKEAARLFELAAAAGDQGAARVLVGLRQELASAGNGAQAPAATAAAPEATPAPRKPAPVPVPEQASARPAPAAAPARPVVPLPESGTVIDTGSDDVLQRSGLPGTDWVKSRPADRYTVQVFANWTAASVARFAREHSLGSAGCAYFETIYDGSPWYALLCGVYDTAAQAQAALDRLPDQVRIMSPWVRSFGDVHRLLARAEAPPPAAGEAATAAIAPAPPPAPGAAARAPGEWPPGGEVSAWVRTRDPAHYTVQLYSGNSEQAARGFIRQNKLQGKAAYFVSQRDGLPWYSVIYGSFDGYSVAKAAARALPANARKWSPWIREFGDIQALLDQGKGAGPTPAPRKPAPVSRADSGQQLAAGQAAFNTGDYRRALDAWRPLADAGLAQAQYNVAFLLETGWAGERDLQESARLYGEAARQGHPQAQYNLGILYLEGHGVARNEETGLSWLRRSAEGGYEKAREKLAEGYSRGLYGLPRDAELAAYWSPARP